MTPDRLDVCFYMPYISPLLAQDAAAPATGGAETQIHLLTQALARLGYAVGVVANDVPGGLPEMVGGVRIAPLRLPAPGTRSRKTHYLPAVLRALRAADARVLVQRSAGVETGVLSALARVRRRRFAYSSANVVDFDFGTLERSRARLRAFELGVRFADHVIVQTDEQAALCVRRFGRRPSVIRSLAEPAGPSAAARDAFLWVGRLTEYKRPLAYLELARSMPGARFRMVGVPNPGHSEAIEAELRREAAGLDNLEVLGPMPRTELLPLIDQAVAMVNTADYEGMPNIFLEAWSRGIPALALSHDPDGVIVRHGLGHWADGNAAAFAEQARELWTARGELSQRCLDYIAEWHAPEAVARQWAQALRLG